MLRNWTFGRKVAAGFAVTIIALAVVGGAGYRSIKGLIYNNERVAHTHEVGDAIAALLQQLTDAETGQRGFLLTGKDEYLEPYTAGSTQAMTSYLQLRSLTADNPNQQRRLDTMRAPLDARLAILKQMIDLRRTSGVEAVSVMVTRGEGKQAMDQIRQLAAEFLAEEKQLLAERQREAAEAAELSVNVITYGSLLALVLAIAVAVVITRSLGSQVGTAVRHIESSSTELQTVAHQQASGAREQSTAMTEITTTIDELLVTSRQIADSAQRVAQIAGQTAASARSGDATVVKGKDAMVGARKQVETVVGHVLEMGRRSQQVGTVLEIIGELAEQTNIIAINATIEAAGAGESGRRFAVVADEIRKLADRVTASTKEIRGMVDEVRNAVNTSVMATEAGSKAVDAGAAQVLDMADAFREIAAMVATASDAAREIELSTKQQATAIEQIKLAITSVAQATKENEVSAGQTLQTSAQLTTLSSELLRLVQAQQATARA
jgi:methyl-accepting chemotaxis protein